MDKTIPRRCGGQWPDWCSVPDTSQKCVHGAHRSVPEAADTVQGLFQDLKARPSSHAMPSKTLAILRETGNKGNCYVAREYKYTGRIAMECRSVPFHCTSLNLEHTVCLCRLSCVQVILFGFLLFALL